MSLDKAEDKDVYAHIRPEYEKLYHINDPDGINISPVFTVLPPRKDYPDYYAVIRNPISLNTLKKRLFHYTSVQKFIDDLVQIPWNAKTYNTRDSEIFRYAIIFEKFIKETTFPNLKKLCPDIKYTNLGPLPDEQGYKEFQEELERKELEKQQNNNKIEEPINVKAKMPKIILRKLSNEHQNLPEYNEKNQISTGEEINSSHNNHADENSSTFHEKRSYKTRNIMSNYSSPSGSPQPFQLRASYKPVKKYVKRGRPPIIDLPHVQRIKNVLKFLRKDQDERRRPLIDSFERIPDRNYDPQYYSIISNPISLDEIRKKVKTRKYKTFATFQDDFLLMLSNFRAYHRKDPIEIKKAVKLEKSFYELAQFELSKPDTDYMPEGDFRCPLDEIVKNDVSYQVGDWVLLRNRNDETNPIVGQIFKLWTEGTAGTQWINACWYLRPEQTVHRADRLFYKTEVVKSGQYRDHKVSDILGKCYVVHFTRFQRGNPDIKIEGPLFVCEYRYNESERVFNKIRTWRACLPEEIRDVEEQTIPVPGRKFFKYPSPIKHLLPPNATVHDPVPDPTLGDPRAPPVVGAVYLRPKLDRDDLGEYSTSDDCPRYIIRPNDPKTQLDGKIENETGTMITSMSTAKSIPTINYSTPKLNVLSESGNSNMDNIPRQNIHTPYSLSLSKGNVTIPNLSRKNGPITVTDLHSRNVAKYIAKLREEEIDKLLEAAKYCRSTTVSKINSEVMYERPHDQAIKSTPNAFVLPLAIKKNIEVLHKTDIAHQLRSNDTNILPKRRNREDIIWYPAPAISVSQRLVDQGYKYDDKLNVLIDPTNPLDYDEFDEVIPIVRKRSKRGSRKAQEPQVEEASSFPEASLEEDKEEEALSKNLQTSSLQSIKPSAIFMSHKLNLPSKTRDY
ncbi:Chromatin structure-remodeling complex subunit RSC1 [Nakaseomyces bracarensis]|uniref:Chromatin structure-remodeling complex subunit RSC1 n=1 Tax=Nakaseomyces bracarensis TaxID=273131 RepID=A0ABR4NV61_9SACH